MRPVNIQSKSALVGQKASPLPAFLLLYGSLYCAYGAESAYMPAFLLSHGLPVERVGVVLAAGTAIGIVTGPSIGRLADRLRQRRQVLTAAAGLSGFIGGVYLIAFGFFPLLMTSMAQAAATVALAPLSDSLSTAAAESGRRFQYGWVRGLGSAAFVLGTLLSGQLIDRLGLACIIVSSSILFLSTSLCAWHVSVQVDKSLLGAEAGTFGTLWSIPIYRNLIFVAVLVIGSHALNDGFAVISWRRAGYGSGAISVLWSEAVLTEVATFFLLGPWLIARLGLARCASLSASAGIVRWAVMGATTWMPAIAGVQALHGLTFALLHMVAMQVISNSVPERLVGTAQNVYGPFALGLASATLTFASGYLFGWLGMRAFWTMGLLCVLALPLTARDRLSAAERFE
jgi:PPP family 3-phenylpropionic acid transporter